MLGAPGDPLGGGDAAGDRSELRRQAEGVEAVLWQTKPVPAQTLLQEKRGFGRVAGKTEGDGCPWDHGAPVSYDLAQYPKTQALLDSSLCLFSQTCPIYAQPRDIAEKTAEAFAKVWHNLPELCQKLPTSSP